ncbi:hypothetical protein [Chondromyces crocatus]|uniref:PD-(D/E)XK endonuclease-like domain-containing protein n=1 Tax=Chondromyces crocatus TaxID=52 RepID=A0A0K1EAI7_CHOCO|nr:hypothetical protein [Chondromyces crocatus]AKT37687.1 uncharacterized protein CMC5_018290 [Chondromyces crocatus]
MSVCDLITNSEVKALLDRVIPSYDRMLRLPIRVASRSRRAPLIGTAFDYALRFELQRRCPQARDQGWVAEHALHVLNAGYLSEGADPFTTAQLAERVRCRVDDARVFQREHLRQKQPDRAWMERLADHALRLARLDSLYRAGYHGPELFAENSTALREEVLALLACVPREIFTGRGEVLLNPTFGKYSSWVGGADADLITDDRLIDIKVVAQPNVERGMVRQLVAYLILATCARRDGELMPPIAWIQLYFARHGHLWSMPAASILEHPAYAEVERGILQVARAMNAPRFLPIETVDILPTQAT